MAGVTPSCVHIHVITTVRPPSREGEAMVQHFYKFNIHIDIVSVLHVSKHFLYLVQYGENWCNFNPFASNIAISIKECSKLSTEQF